jgi:pyruvate ferredoxin oxidoreductase alpha subunit
VLLAYRLAEHPGVRVPVLVNLDGFYLSFTREPVAIPAPEAVRRFLPAFDPGSIRFRASAPISQAVAVLGGGPYSYFRYELHRAALQALKAWDEVSNDFARELGRRYAPLETHRVEDAEVVFFMLGSFATKALDAVERMRGAGLRVGLVRPRLLRPWPADAIRSALSGVRGVAVIDQNLSMGRGGVLHTELASTLYGHPDAPVLASFVGGLGGRDIAPGEFQEMASVTREAADTGRAPEPRLLYTARELRELRKLQGVALAERHETAPAAAPGEQA